MITDEGAAISALTYRLNQIEKRIAMVNQVEPRFAMQEHKITQLAGMIAKLKDDADKGQIDKFVSIIDNIRLTIHRKKITQRVLDDYVPLETPNELLPELQISRNNRPYEIVKKRWELWKTQIDSGATPAQLARAWGCDRGSVYHAIKNKFVASRGTGRIPKSRHSAMRAKKSSIK
jgi:uncharacterized coiled-coil protein SlyX